MQVDVDPMKVVDAMYTEVAKCNALVVNYFILVLFRVLVYYLNINM